MSKVIVIGGGAAGMMAAIGAAYNGNTVELLEKNDKNNLNMDSIVKTDVIYKILNNQILFKIGKVDTTKIEEYKNNFIENNKEN